MYYEFYIDVFFVVNLFMDFLVLCLTNRILRGTARPWRALWGALAGAALISLFFWTAKEINIINMLIFSLGTTLVMVRLGCGLRKGKELLTGFLTWRKVARGRKRPTKARRDRGGPILIYSVFVTALTQKHPAKTVLCRYTTRRARHARG